MHRNFYSSSILFACLYILIVITSSAAFFLIGQRLGELTSFGSWYLVQLMFSFTWSLILLRYFYSKQYWMPFWTFIILIIASAFHLAFSIDIISTSEITNSYVIATHVVPAGIALLGISLMLSKSKERVWLKINGIFYLTLGLGTLAGTVWIHTSLTALHDGTAIQMTQWGSILEIIAPVLLVMNFIDERQESAPSAASSKTGLGTVIGFVVFLGFLIVSFFGYKLVTEATNLSDITTYNEYESKLAIPFEARTFTSDEGEILLYRLLIPRNYDPGKTYPLVVSLHGSSGRGNDNVKQVSRTLIASLLSEGKNQLKYPAFVFVPQCPLSSDWGGITDITAIDLLMLDAISELEKEFSIDQHRRYVTGISMGGFGVWHLITSQPDMFAAAIPICGAGDPDLAGNLTDMPIWAFHGALDRNVLVRGSQDMIAAIESKGGNPRYTEFSDRAHHISSDVSATPGLLDWLFAQKKGQLKELPH